MTATKTRDEIAYEELYNAMTESDVATPEELRLVCQICGFRPDVLQSVLFIRTGCRNLEQFFDL